MAEIHSDSTRTSIAVEHIRGGAYRLTSSFIVRRPLDTVFRFFSDAHNLETLTPPWLRFRVLTPAPITIERGTRIDYALRIHGVPIRWKGEIDVWEPPFRFADRQLRGPYRRWQHEHTFQQCDTGTLVRDCVDFEVHGGRLAGRFVAADVRRVFSYRRDCLLDLFTDQAPRRTEETI